MKGAEGFSHLHGSSKHPRAAERICGHISECWGNGSWKQQPIQPGLPSVSTTSENILRDLLTIAQRTSGSYRDGYPPLVLKTLKECLEAKKRDVESYERSLKSTTFGWPQGPVIKAILPIILQKTQPLSPLMIKKTTNSASSSSNDVNQSSGSPSKYKKPALKDLEKAIAAKISTLPESPHNEQRLEMVGHYEKLQSYLTQSS